MLSINRRALLGSMLLLTVPATARGRYRVVDVDIRASPIVASRIRTDLPGRIAARLLAGRHGGDVAVRVVVDLRTIDPYRAGQRNVRRGIAVRYAVVDARTGRTLKSDRFIERTTIRDDVEGSIAVLRVPRTRGEQERELADEVARHILRYGL